MALRRKGFQWSRRRESQIVCDLMDNEEMALIQRHLLSQSLYGQRWKELNYIKEWTSG